MFYLVSCILLVIPAYGYATRAIREVVEGSNKMPEYNGWGRMIVDGIKVWVLLLVYILVMLILILIPTFILVAGMYFYQDYNLIGLILMVIGGLLILLAVLVDIVLFMMVFIAWAILAVTGSLLKALNPLKPLKMMIKKPVGTLALMTQMLVVTIVAGIVSCLVITTPWATFLSVMSYAYLLANFYKSTTT